MSEKQSEEQLLVVGEVARVLGVSVRRVKQLEDDEGRITSRRTVCGWRLYAVRDVERLAQEREAAKRMRA